jgi:hypothetical protein
MQAFREAVMSLSLETDHNQQNIKRREKSRTRTKPLATDIGRESSTIDIVW